MSHPGPPAPRPGVTVREMTAADLDAVCRIEGAVNPRPWTRALLSAELGLPPAGRDWVVACAGDSIVGYAGVMYAGLDAHLMLVGVDPAHTRQGIGRRLCVELCDAAKARGMTGLTLEVRASNRPAIGLYHSLGMTEVGVRRGYYPDGEDAIIFWLDDLGAAERAGAGPGDEIEAARAPADPPAAAGGTAGSATPAVGERP